MRFIDPTGNQAEGDEEENKEENIWNKFLRFIGLLSEVNNKYAQPEMENDIDMLANSEEMKGAKIIALEVDKAKKKTVRGIDYIHDVASTTSGAAAIGALSSISNPETAILAPILTTTTTITGVIAAGASGLNWAITGESRYINNFIYEGITIGIGAGANSIRAGKTLTPENEEILRQVYKNFVSGTSLGIGFKVEK